MNINICPTADLDIVADRTIDKYKRTVHIYPDRWVTWVYTVLHPKVDIYSLAQRFDLSESFENTLQPYMHDRDYHIDIKSTFTVVDNVSLRKYFYRLTSIMGKTTPLEIELMNL